VRSVNHKGALKWKGRMLYLAETLANEHVALQEIGDDTWRVYFADVPLGVLEHTRFRREAPAGSRPTTRQHTSETEDKV
jgi:hypothetical protein